MKTGKTMGKRTEKTRGKLLLAAITVLMFAAGGAMLWGVRGAAGYGGTSGAVLPGLWWGLCWYALDSGRNRHIGWVVLACAFGYGFGGMHGYGQFMSWTTGVFEIDSAKGMSMPISPATGFLWWAITGLGWGGFGGILASIALYEERKARIIAAWAAVLVIGWMAGAYFAKAFPQIVYPLYSAKTYDLSVCADCKRTLRTLPTQCSFIAMLIFSSAFAAARGRLPQLRTILISAAGFALAFVLANLQHVYFSYWMHLDTWKVCEMLTGFIGGASVGVMYLIHASGGGASDAPRAAQPALEKIIGVNLALLLVLGWGGMNCAGVAGKVFFGLKDGSAASLAVAGVLGLVPGIVLFAVAARNIVKSGRAPGVAPAGPGAWLKLRAAITLMLIYGVLVTVKEAASTSIAFIILGGVALAMSAVLQRKQNA